MDINERIQQWQNMTEADPTNDMGWFSLGSAYKDADQLEQADAAFAKALEINPAMSRAIQLRGQVLISLNKTDEAATLLTEGYKTAAAHGDVMPQKAIGALLEKLNLPIPEIESESPQSTVTDNQIVDRRTGRPGTRMTEPPVRGPLGKFIADHYSEETWREWIGMGTKVINEFRLDFSNIEHQKVYDQQMMLWLGFTEDELNS